MPTRTISINRAPVLTSGPLLLPNVSASKKTRPSLLFMEGVSRLIYEDERGQYVIDAGIYNKDDQLGERAVFLGSITPLGTSSWPGIIASP